MAGHRSRQAWPVLPIGAILCGLGHRAIAKPPLIKGICYGPFPAKGPVYAAQIIDDFMTDPAKPLWGPQGRNDMQTIVDLGANTVRLYGNNPNASHTEFLNYADRLGLGVVPGISDYPYTQQKNACTQTNFNCYDQVKHSFAGDLRNGWLTRGGYYHRAIKYIIVINEPDLKLLGNGIDPKRFSKGILSAVDAILDAEREAGVQGELPGLTATFSFGTCTSCHTPKSSGKPQPALSQMLELKTAFLYPEAYGYTPRNDLKAAYDSRFVNSFNTQNSASELPKLFFNAYSEEFPKKPVFIGEFHSIHPPKDQSQELASIMALAQKSPEFIGFNWFEFQTRYDKGGTEAEFGMFGLGNYEITSLHYFGETYKVWCLDPVRDTITRQRVPEELSQAFGGKGLDYFHLCDPNPAIVPLTDEGFRQIKVGGSASGMKTFVNRAVAHLGGEVIDQAGFTTFAQHQANIFQNLLSLWTAKPSWASFDDDAACVADRNSDSYAVSQTIEKACQLTNFNCKDIPWSCKGDPWKTADYVLSTVFPLLGGNANPLDHCYFQGSAIYAMKALYKQVDRSCVVNKDPYTTPLSEQGFQAMLQLKDPPKMEAFFERVIRNMGAAVRSPVELQTFAANPPTSMYEVQRLLTDAKWVCGGLVKEKCSLWGGRGTSIWWWRYAMFSLAALVVMFAVTVCCCVKNQRACRGMCPKRCFDDPLIE